MRTALCFAHECAPFNAPESTIGAQRPAQFAKLLPEFGWRVIVLCCDGRARGMSWPTGIRETTRAALREADPERSVIIPLPALPYDGTIDRAWRALAKPSRSASRLRALARKPLTIAKLFSGDYSQHWQPVAREAAQVVAEETTVDICIGEHSPDSGMFVARWFSKRYDVPWVADFRDPMLYPISPRVRAAFVPLARHLLASAASVVNVTPNQVEIDRAVFRRPTALVTNGFDPEEFARRADAPAAAGAPLTIAYLGSIWLFDEFEIFARGMAMLRDRVGVEAARSVRLVYRGVAFPFVRDLVERLGLSDMVDAAPRIARDEALRLMCSADSLLLLSPFDHFDPYWKPGVYPGKTFEYFGAARPIICVSGDGGILDELLARTRTGVSLRTSGDVAAHLEAMLREYQAGRRPPYAPDDAERMRYTRRHQMAAFASVLDRAVRSTAAPEQGAALPHATRS